AQKLLRRQTARQSGNIFPRPRQIAHHEERRQKARDRKNLQRLIGDRRHQKADHVANADAVREKSVQSIEELRHEDQEAKRGERSDEGLQKFAEDVAVENFHWRASRTKRYAPMRRQTPLPIHRARSDRTIPFSASVKPRMSNV